MGVAAKLIRTLNDATGATSLVVSHDVPECMAIADWVVLLATGGRIVAQGTPAELMASTDPRCASSCAASPTGRCKFHYPAPTMRRTSAWGCRHERGGWPPSARVRAWQLAGIGWGALFFVDLLRALPPALRRFGWW
jgi:hypothetical protein